VSEGRATEEALSELAHDLRTPISVILGYAELLERRSAEDKTREAAGHILEAAERLLAVVDRLVHDIRTK
jgi:signal transduction histidine kinase